MSGFSTKLLDNVKARKLAYYGHTMRKQGNCPEKEIMKGTMPGARRRGRPRTAWIDNVKSWTGLSVEESIRMTEDRDGVANLRIEDGYKEQNRIEARQSCAMVSIRRCFGDFFASCISSEPRAVHFRPAF